VGTVKVVTTTITVTADEKSDVGNATAMCAAGDIAIGGGVSTETDGWSVRASNPNSTDKNPTGWFGEITGNGEAEHDGDNSGNDGKDNSSVTSSVDNKNDENQNENQNDDENVDQGAATGTVYAVCMTP
jgi:hypothetical protein